MKEMEMIKREIKIPRYELILTESPFTEFMIDMGYGDNHGDEEILLAYFNTNFTGAREFKKNFLNLPEIAYTSVEQIKKQAEELALPEWAVVSFYRENGYDGVYANSGDDALTTKCNNWVNFGEDGFYYVVFAKTEEELSRFLSGLQQYINEGSLIYEVYDNLEDDYIDEFYLLGATRESYLEWQQKAIEKYNFKESDFR